MGGGGVRGAVGLDPKRRWGPYWSALKSFYVQKKDFPYILFPLKGTVSQDFLLLVFFMNQYPPSP